jgi:hypothetical protein
MPPLEIPVTGRHEFFYTEQLSFRDVSVGHLQQSASHALVSLPRFYRWLLALASPNAQTAEPMEAPAVLNAVDFNFCKRSNLPAPFQVDFSRLAEPKGWSAAIRNYTRATLPKTCHWNALSPGTIANDLQCMPPAWARRARFSWERSVNKFLNGSGSRIVRSDRAYRIATISKPPVGHFSSSAGQD